MIHRVFSDLPSFKNLDFKPGLNVLLADKTEESTELQTRNRAGKSSLVEIIHYLLGASVDKNSMFREDAIKNHCFGLDFDLRDQRIVVNRCVKNFNRITVVSANTDNWPVQPISYRGVARSFSHEDWCSLLGEYFFNLRIDHETERGKFSPTFRSLFPYFARKEKDGGIRVFNKQSDEQQIYDQQVAISYLIGLDWKIAKDWELVRRRERTLRELKKAVQTGAFGNIIPTSAELRTALVIAEESSRRIHNSLENFEVFPEYREFEVKASEITRDLANYSNQNTIDEQLIGEIQSALIFEEAPKSDDLLRLYEEAGLVLSNNIKKRFQDVKDFHYSIISNRRNYLESELNAARERLHKRRNIMSSLDVRRAEIMRILQSRGALDQFQKLQKDASRIDAETEAIRQKFQAAEQLEGNKTELEIERARLTQRLRRDLDEQSGVVSEAITTFENISNSLYENAGSLHFTTTENGLKPEVKIQGQTSRGIKNMQIVCFDFMLMKLCSNKNIGSGFLIHDSHIFDGVDERQVAKAIQIGATIAEDCDWQYLVTLNSDDVPSEFEKGFNFNRFILPVRLTDATEDGGLFGIRF